MELYKLHTNQVVPTKSACKISWFPFLILALNSGIDISFFRLTGKEFHVTPPYIC